MVKITAHHNKWQKSKTVRWQQMTADGDKNIQADDNRWQQIMIQKHKQMTADDSRWQQMTADDSRWQQMTVEKKRADDSRWRQKNVCRWQQMTSSYDGRWQQRMAAYLSKKVLWPYYYSHHTYVEPSKSIKKWKYCFNFKKMRKTCFPVRIFGFLKNDFVRKKS